MLIDGSGCMGVLVRVILVYKSGLRFFISPFGQKLENILRKVEIIIFRTVE